MVRWQWTTPCSSSMWIERLLCVALLSCTSLDAYAQGCCAFGSSLTPTRLDLHERLLVGFQVGASGLHGSHTANADYHAAPNGTTDVELRQTLFATSAIGSRVQASVLLPWVETYRRVPSSSGEWGHGLGDISALVRADLVQLHEYPDVPGVALLLGGLFPTGTPVESATQTLGSDATGGGVYRVLGGVSAEQAFGSWLINVTATASFAPPAKRAGIATQHAPRWSFVAGTGYAWSHRLSTAGSVSFETEGDTKVDGANVSASHKRRTELALITTYAIDDNFRAQARLSAEPPLAHLGANEPARLTGNLALIWSAL